MTRTRANILGVIAVAALLASAPCAARTQDERLFETFTSCDRTFFETLAKERSHWSEVMELTAERDIAYPVVQDRRYERINWQKLRRPIIVGGVRLIAYHDAKTESPTAAGSASKLLYWGFLAEGDPADLAEKLRPHIRNGKAMSPAKGVDWPAWIRGELRHTSDSIDQWTKMEISLGTDPTPNTVERVLIIEGTATGPGLELATEKATVECSLQGSLQTDFLHFHRPDLSDASIADW